MTDLTVIILVGNEELHIRRCLERLAPLEPRQVFVVESQTGDRTHEIAIQTAAQLGWRSEKWEVRSENLNKDEKIPQLVTSRSSLLTCFHAWPGNQAQQLNWVLDALGASEKCGMISGKCGSWILRLDADEYLTPETIENLKHFLSSQSDQSSTTSHLSLLTSHFSEPPAGLTLELKRRFCGGEIRHATNGIRLLRLWRTGRGRSEVRSMDEHIAIDGVSELDELRRLGKVIDFGGAFYDDNLNAMDWWRAKHRGYAKREAADALAFARGEIRFKPAKEKYYRLPRYFRAFAYFCLRYFLKGGFLDGYAGWMWNFWQGLWYRWIVDREIGREGKCLNV